MTGKAEKEKQRQRPELWCTANTTTDEWTWLMGVQFQGKRANGEKVWAQNIPLGLSQLGLANPELQGFAIDFDVIQWLFLSPF